MPTLFISYKRDDKVAVTKITDRLRKDYYFDIWIDAISIPGGEDWRAEIRKGIDKADVVLLMLTPDACASEQVKEEIDYAKSVGRRIIPLQIKAVTNDDLNKLGVERVNYIDFNASYDDRFAWEKLLNDLPDVLERDKRLLDPKFKALHQDYLRSLFTRYGKLSLSYLLDATPKERVSLFDVYVRLFLGTLIWGEVQDGELVDWWVSDNRTDKLPKEQRTQSFNGMRVDPMSLANLVQRMRDFVSELAGRKDGIKDGEYSLWRLESEEAPALVKHIVITGAPGSGKSTLLKHLALCMAGDMLSTGDESDADLNKLGFWPLPAYTPIFVELRALVRTAFPDPKAAVTLDRFFDYIQAEQLKPHGIESYLDDLRAQLRDGDAMIFLDGLDEVPDADTAERREQIKTLAHLLSQQYPHCRICITSRPYAYAGDWQLDGFGQVTLTNLDPDRLEELALRLFRVVLGQEGAEQEAESFKKQMKNVPEELRGSPLFFTLMASIWLNNTIKPAAERLPVTKGDIYRECVEMLIRRWTRKDAISGQSMLDDIGLSEGDLRRVLQALAYQVHSEAGESDDAEFTGGRIMDTVRELKLKRVDIDGLCDALAQRAGVIYERAPNRYQYAHRSFQEHLAACYLAEDGRYPQVLADDLRQKPALWRNVMELLPDEARRQKRDLWQLVKALLPEKDATLPDTADDPVWDSIFHAARLMFHHLPADDDLQDLYRPRLQKLILKIIEISALAPVDRAEMGRILAELGDPRPGIGLDERGLPDIYKTWCDVPAGEFIYQDGEKVSLKTSFKIAKYPVTVAQFDTFLATNPQNNDALWDGMPDEDEDWDGTKYNIREFRETRDNYANHPRTYVSWYQSIAFCRWLTKVYHEAGVLDADHVIWLAHEKQWERAARGTDGREYPYEGEFDAAKGNTSETGIRMTSAVGIFPHGVSPVGALDMSGNVWDWCASKYNAPDDILPDSSSAARVVRGGSFFSHYYGARAAFPGLPDNHDLSYGLRCVCVPSSLLISSEL